MFSILDFKKKYYKKIDVLDLEVLISATIKKPREFVLAHPEYKIPATHNLKLETFIQRRLKDEPMAYILGQKEFYGLEFKVSKNTLIPRPETEMLVELASHNIKHEAYNNKKNKLIVADIGTGSGNIIISLVKNLIDSSSIIRHSSFYAIDISSKALNIAKQNAKFHKIRDRVKFLRGNLLEPIIRNLKLETRNFIIVSNLPYLSPKIYSKVSPNIKNYEPKSALLSKNDGLDHYKKLFQQIKKLQVASCEPCLPAGRLQVFLEFSPEQKTQLKKTVLSIFPQSHLTFFKDLAGKFRVVQIKL